MTQSPNLQHDNDRSESEKRQTQGNPPAWYKQPLSWVFIVLALSVLVFLAGIIAMLSPDDNDTAGSSARVTTIGQTAGPELTESYEVTYRLLGDTTNASLSYSDSTASSGGQEEGAASGWELTTEVNESFGAYLFATNDIAEDGSITCQIEANGVIIAEDTMHGPLAEAICNPSNDALIAAFND